MAKVYVLKWGDETSSNQAEKGDEETILKESDCEKMPGSIIHDSDF
jgi:hypothetical protein